MHHGAPMHKLFIPLIALSAGACAPVLVTQPQRLSYIQDKVEENLKNTMNCEKTQLTHQRSEQRGVEWYDVYTAEGCGSRSDYVTMMKQNAGWTMWAFGLAPSEAQFQTEAQEQLLTTARFDLGCENVEFTVLHALISPMRDAVESSIGVSGCGKKSTYKSACRTTGFVSGKHQISCSNVITSGSGAQSNG